MNLMYAGNQKVFDGLLLSALSAIEQTKVPLHIYLLTMNLTEQNPDFLALTEEHRFYLEVIYRRGNPESTVTLIDVGPLYRQTMLGSPNALTSYTPYTFLRLFADQLTQIPDKILYLDTDTLIVGNLNELYETDIEDYELAAALDYYGKIFLGYHYFNAGVLLLNMKMIRQTNLFTRALALCAKKEIFLPDQTALNRLVKKKKLLPTSCNEQKHDREGTIVRHFAKTILWLPYFHTQNIKPWQTELVKEKLTHRYDGLLDVYLTEKSNYERDNHENAEK